MAGRQLARNGRAIQELATLQKHDASFVNFYNSPIAFLLTLLLGSSLPVFAQSEENDTTEGASLGPDSVALYAPLEDDPLLAQMDSLWMHLGMPFQNSAYLNSADSLPVLPEKSEVARRMQL